MKGEAKLRYCCARDIPAQCIQYATLHFCGGEYIDFSVRSLFVDMLPQCFQHPTVIPTVILKLFAIDFLFWRDMLENYPLLIPKIIMILLADYCCWTFFQHGCSFHFQISLLHFNSKSKWWIHISSRMMTPSKNVRSSSMQLRKSFACSTRNLH